MTIPLTEQLCNRMLWGINRKAGLFMDQCEACAYFVYDDDYEGYVCEADMDEDDYSRLVSGGMKGCPMYRNGDEYRVVRHQM